MSQEACNKPLISYSASGFMGLLFVVSVFISYFSGYADAKKEIQKEMSGAIDLCLRANSDNLQKLCFTQLGYSGKGEM